jgi:predicted RNA-binding protein with RPS1 domain
VSPGPPRTIEVADVEVNKEYDGVIVSIREFGAFVNIGAMTDGLLHISQISTEFVRNVADAVTMNQAVRVRVLTKDLERGKFAVTMIPEGAAPPPRSERAPRGERAEWSEGPPGERPQLKQQARAAKQQKPRTQRSAAPCAVGDSITGKIASVAPFGVFIEVGAGPAGWLMDGGLWQEFFCCLHCPCCILPLRCTRCLLTPCPL